MAPQSADIYAAKSVIVPAVKARAMAVWKTSQQRRLSGFLDRLALDGVSGAQIEAFASAVALEPVIQSGITVGGKSVYNWVATNGGEQGWMG